MDPSFTPLRGWLDRIAAAITWASLCVGAPGAIAANADGEAPPTATLLAAPAEHLHCEVRYASQSWHLDAVPTAQPLLAKQHNVGERFAFRAIVRGTPGTPGEGNRIQHITTQVFDLEAGQEPLVQQFRRSPPWPDGEQVPALTGWQHVYSAVLGRELVYGCAVRPGPPPGVADVAVPQPDPASSGLPPLWRPEPVMPTAPQVSGASTQASTRATDAQTPSADASPTVRLAFVGDVMLADGPGRVIASGRDPFAHVAERLRQADVRIGNLECVIARQGHALDKPWTFRADPRVLPVLKRHLDVVSVANNHVGDFGREAFTEMLGHLDASGIPRVGGGRNLTEAHRPLIVEKHGLRIALLAYDEFFPRSFEAGPDRPGSAWSDDEQVVDDIRRARTEHRADLVIPFMHWGSEGEPVSNARQRQLARLMIDAGADAVVGAHPHVVQDAEVYRGKPIVYSLGNFVFDGFESLEHRTGWMLFFTVDRGGVRQWHVEPVRTDVEGTPHPQVAPPAWR